jgi:hypothetical protein
VKAEPLLQRERREQAELAIEKLRDRLRTVAKAGSAAGLRLDAFCGEKYPMTRLQTSPARIRASADEDHRR